MAFTIKKVSSEIENKILWLSVFYLEYLKNIVPLYDSKYIKNEYARYCINTSIDYFKQYGKPIGESLWDSLELLQEKNPDKFTQVNNLLTLLEENYSEVDLNSMYEYDHTVQYFREQSIRSVLSHSEELLDKGDVTLAEDTIRSYNRLKTSNTAPTQGYNDKDLIKQAFSDDYKGLFEVEGELGKLLNNHLVREGFIMFQAPPKTGKSFWLKYFEQKALEAGLKVFFASTGDMSLPKITKRDAVRLSRTPAKHPIGNVIKIPQFDCRHNINNTCNLDCRRNKVPRQDTQAFKNKKPSLFKTENPTLKYKVCNVCRNKRSDYFPAVSFKEITDYEILTEEKALEVFENFEYKHNQRTEFYPTNTCTVKDLDDEIQRLIDEEGFVPDVVIVDYMSTMKVDKSSMVETSNGSALNSIYKEMRSLGQKYNCLIITADQAKIKSIFNNKQTAEDFTGSSHKYDHLTGAFALLQTPNMKRNHIYLWHSLDLGRDEEYEYSVACLECKTIGQVHLDSCRFDDLKFEG